jgi:non-ribosomal peptide synthetase component F
LQVDISIYIDGKGNLGMDYMAELFDPSTIQSIGDSLHRMLEGAAASPAAGIWGLPILGQANKAQLARMTSGEVRPHYVPGGGAALTVERFERIAASEPSRPCLIFNGATLSYGEVNARANRLAHWLRAAGVGRDVAVGVMLDRSFELVIAMLAAMKVGCTWSQHPFVLLFLLPVGLDCVVKSQLGIFVCYKLHCKPSTAGRRMLCAPGSRVPR